MKTTEEIEKLNDQAWELIHEEKLKEAAEIGHKLKAEGIESGYRIVATTYVMEEKFDRAIAELKDGIKRIPDSWELHLQLGNFLSDNGDFDEAIRTLDQASRLPGAEKHWINLNKAVVYTRKADFDKALNLLQKIEHAEAVNQAFELQLRILDQLGHHDLILQMEDELEYLQTPEDEESAETLSQICTHIARAYYMEEDNDAAKHYIRQAVEYQRTNTDAAELLREINGQFSENSRIYSFVINGLLNDPESGDEIPFFTTYGVVADSEEEALELIHDYEIEAVDKNSLEISQVDSTENTEGDPKGIYLVGGFAFLED
ncbi:MAG: tetratricopeptide repeat protein [Bacteroidia bacterium]|nr:tetratricopeptide repeat protein [Bacteroidia bacterium]